jgi:hypothetical protein
MSSSVIRLSSEIRSSVQPVPDLPIVTRNSKLEVVSNTTSRRAKLDFPHFKRREIESARVVLESGRVF